MRLERRSSFGWGATPAPSAPCRNGIAVHYDGSNQGLAGKTHSACRSYWSNTRRFHINTNGWLDIGYCVDASTEILTSSGWRTYHDVRPGDIALTLDHDTGLSHWQAIEDVYVFPARPRSMIRMAGPAHSSLTTSQHRWAVERGHERRWATSATLTPGDRIPLAAPCGEFPSEAKWSDGFVEVLAWFCKSGPADAARFKAALYAAFGAPVESFRADDSVPRWRADGLQLSAAAERGLLEQAPDRVPSLEFLRSLTRAQLDLFLAVSLRDGRGFSRDTAEALQFACILAGHATSLQRESAGWTVTLGTSTHFQPVRVQPEPYEGVIWCPRTPNGTWLARRAGTVYFTGNSAAVCPHGIVMEGRGFFRAQAAQPGGNTTWTSVTFMSGPSERPTNTQINAFRELRSWLRGQGVASAIRGHRDFISTSCPGNILYRMVQDGTLAGRPSTDPPEEEPLRIVVSLGTSSSVSIPAGERQDIRLDREYSDPGGVHATDAHGVAPTENGYYQISAAVRLEGLPEGQAARLSFARFHEDDEQTYDRDMFAQTCAGVTAGAGDYQMSALEYLSKDNRYRLAIRNQSDTPITVATAYLKLAR